MIEKLLASIEKLKTEPNICLSLGIELVSLKPGEAIFEMLAKPEQSNFTGTLHGGVMVDISDVAMGIAAATLIDESKSFTTIDLQTHFFRPVFMGTKLRAVGKVVKQGTTIFYTECELWDENQKLVAKTNSNLMILNRDQSKGRGMRG